MKAKIRLSAILLIAAMLLSLFSACVKAPDATIPNKDAAPPATAPEVTLNPLTGDAQLKALPNRDPDGGKKEYTVMLYLVGSDLESNYGCATEDLDEILYSGLDTSRVNFLVYIGGSRYWHSGFPSDRNVVYRLTPGGWEAVASTATINNMGDPATFLDFMNFSYQNYPAANYGMICWDHGGGPLAGYGFDELYGNDRLFLTEMDAAFQASPFAGEKLDFLGFDACLLATMEMAEMASR
jgi:hypothetical protein